MIKIHEVIVVEGRYDKNTLSQIVEGVIIETEGFGIFSDDEKIALLRKLGLKRGLIILTDSDSAGFLIRGHLSGQLSGIPIKHAYIPDIHGREKRKRSASKEGKLGVEGMDRDIIIKALMNAGATIDGTTGTAVPVPSITKTDLFIAGLTGTPHSATRREALLRGLNLPEHLSTNGLLDVLRALYSKAEFLEILHTLHID